MFYYCFFQNKNRFISTVIADMKQFKTEFIDPTRTRTGINRLGGGCPIQLCYETITNP